MDKFFDTIRGLGLKRGPQRWVGGVCGGVAAKLNVDVAYVRIAYLLLSLLPGPAFVVYLAAVFAYPCRWPLKILGALLGAPALLLLNQVRLVSLAYVGHLYPAVFDIAHMLVWQSLIILVTVVLWILWAAVIAGRHETASP